MFGFQRTPYDVRFYEEKLRDFLPDTMIDNHVHVYKKEMVDSFRHPGQQSWPRLVAEDCSIEDLEQSYLDMFPGKRVIPVLMSEPNANLTVANNYVLECAKARNLPVLYCTDPTMPADEIRHAIKDRGFCGIKPYLNHSPSYIPANEIRIFDFLPREHLEVLNELGGIAILHIARPGRLKDPVNVAQMMMIDADYPNAKVIIAHTGRAYAPEDVGDAFETLKHSKHLLFDFTANTLSYSMEACIKAVGTDRFLFGSDMPITKMRMYRIAENGTYINVVPRGLYGDVSNDPHMRESDSEEISNFMYEELNGFRIAAESLKLTRKQIEDVMCNNAARIFGMENLIR